MTQKEENVINSFLKSHPYIRNFSTLVRAALFSYLKGEADRNLADSERPSFLWDYKLTTGEIHEILNGPRDKRKWLVARILTHAKWEEIWKYLTPKQIEEDLPYLKLPEKDRAHWQLALTRWKNTP